jgi:hypothetical protein
MSRKFHCRPSQLLSIDDPYSAWCLDEAVYQFGVHVDSELERVGSDVKDDKQRQAMRVNYLQGILHRRPELRAREAGATAGKADDKPVASGRFRDPAGDRVKGR